MPCRQPTPIWTHRLLIRYFRACNTAPVQKKWDAAKDEEARLDTQAEKALETLSTLRPTSERSEWEAGWDEEGMDDVALTETRGQRLVRDKFDRGAFAFAATFWHSDFIMPFTVSYSGYVHTTGGWG